MSIESTLPSNRTADLAATSAVRLWCRSGRAREIRDASGLTLAELGALADIAPQTLCRWERNQRVPRGANALRYYRALLKAQEMTAAAHETSA